MTLLLVLAAIATVAAEEAAIKVIYDKGITHYNAGKYDLALHDFKKVVDREAASDDVKARAQIWIGRCYKKKEDLPKAIEAFGKAAVAISKGHVNMEIL